MTVESPAVGLLLAGQFTPTEDPVRGVAETLEQVRLAREAGFASVWLSQHLLSEYQFLQPFPMLGRIAADAGDMTIGTAVTLAPLYPAALLAEEAASIDILTGGRFILGVGIGYRPAEYEAVDLDFHDRTGRLEEAVDVLRQLWSGEPVHTVGDRFAHLKGARLTMRPPQGAGLPVWVGASAPRAVDRAARIGDEWLMPPEITLPALLALQQRYENAADATPFPREHPLLRESFAARSDETAVTTALPALGAKYAGYGRSGHQVAGVDAMVADDVFVLGGPERCADLLRRYAEALGSRHLIVRMQWPGFAHDLTMDSISLYGEEILPRLAGPTGR